MKSLGAPCPAACTLCRPRVPSWLLMVTEPAGKSSVLYWTAASYSPPAPSLLLPPIPAAFFFRSRQMASAPPLPVTPGPGFSRGRGRRQTPACPAPPGNPRAGRRPGVQPEQAARGWRRRCRPKSGTKPSLSADPTRANFLHLLALGKQIFVMGLWGEVAESVHPASLCAAGTRALAPVPGELRSQCAQEITGWRQRSSEGYRRSTKKIPRHSQSYCFGLSFR